MTKVNDAVKLKIADDEVLISIDTTAVRAQSATTMKELMVVACGG